MQETHEQPLYEKVAQSIEGLIRSGALRGGEKVPSVRRTSLQQGVSITTVIEAFRRLEDQGLIEGREKSGFYVRALSRWDLQEPVCSSPPSAVTLVTVGDLQARMFEATRMPDIVSLGGAAPAAELLPTVKLNRLLASEASRRGREAVGYSMPPGSESLRREIAKRSLDGGTQPGIDEIITTCGGTEALMLCLRAVTKPGDIVAVESPTYFGILHAVEELGLRALEIPMHPRTGMDLDIFEEMLKQHRVAACVSVPNISNPMGTLMPDENKARLVDMLASHEVPLIEDDVFSELHFTGPRPRVAQSFDKKGLVMLCGSFSKTLAPGYRIGWVVPGRFLERVKSLKLMSTMATPSLPELAIAGFLASGGYDHYLRSVRRSYQKQVDKMRSAIAGSFPEGTKVTRPAGGFLLWLELPKEVDALKLDDQALAHKISIAPGAMFSASQGLRNHVRLSCGQLWSEKVEKAIVTLGALAKQQSAGNA